MRVWKVPRARRLLRLKWSIPGKRRAQEERARLYFEVEGLDSFCKALEKNDVALLPTGMPLGWRHAELRGEPRK